MVLGNLLAPFAFLFFISKVKVSLHFRLLMKRKWGDKYCFWLITSHSFPIKHWNLGGGPGIVNCLPLTRGSQPRMRAPFSTFLYVSLLHSTSIWETPLDARYSFNHPNVCSSNAKHLQMETREKIILSSTFPRSRHLDSRDTWVSDIWLCFLP